MNAPELQPEFAVSQLDPKPRIALLVLGMHRSGTSAVARFLSQLGAGLPKHLLAPSDGNQAGHWEPERIVQLNDAILGDLLSGWDDWSAIDLDALSALKRKSHIERIGAELSAEYHDQEVFVLKDPRICRLAPLYLEALDAQKIEPRIVATVRNALSVIASLKARNNIDLTTGQLFWLRHVLDAERATRGVARLFLDYERLLADWRGAAQRVLGELNLPLPEPEPTAASSIDAFLTQDLQHHHATASEADSSPDLLPWVRDAYRALRQLEQNEKDGEGRRALDRIAADFNADAKLFAPLAARMRGDSLRAHYRVWELEQSEQNARNELKRLGEGRENLAKELDAARQALGEAEQSLTATRLDLSIAQAARTTAESERDVLAGDALRAQAARAELGRELHKAHADIEYVRQSFLQSTSWKITAPLRAVMSLARNFRAGPRARASAPEAPGRFGGLLRAVRFHGARGAILKAAHIARTQGVGAMLRQGAKTIRLHAAAAQHAADSGPHQFLDERLEFAVQLGHRPAPSTPAEPSVYIISETDLDQCIRYRIRNKIETLEANDVRAAYGDLRDLYGSLSEMQFYRTLLIYRAPMHDLFMTYHDEARRLGMTILYDLDDPIFDPSVLGGNANLKVIESHYRTGQLRDTQRFRHAMEACDYLLASTPALAELMQRAAPAKPALVWRNVADRNSLLIGASIRARRAPRAGRLLVGYFSGSLAHEADFELALNGLTGLMAKRPEIDLLLFGHVRPRRQLAAFGHRVRTERFSHYDRYLEAVAECDVVVVPLVDNPFNRCKSVVRYLDAALVQTPVIASAVGDYAELVRHGENGWLARTELDWRNLLDAACADPDMRERVGRNAREFVEANFATVSHRPELPAELGALLFGDERAPAGR